MLIIASFFFMPWLGVPDVSPLGFFTVSGSLFEGNPLFREGAPAVALVPIAAVFAIVIAFRGTVAENPNRYKAIGFLIAGLLVLLFFNGFFLLLLANQLQVAGKAVSEGAVYGYGFWIALLAGVGLILQLFRLLEGLRGKIVIAFTLVFSLVFAVAYFWFYQFSYGSALERLAADMRSTLEGLVQGVDGDAVAGLMADVEYTEDVYPTDERYWAHVQWFGTVNEIDPRAIAYSYAFAPGSEDTIVWVGSVGAIGKVSGVDFGVPVGVQFESPAENCPDCRLEDNIQTLRDEQSNVSTEVYSDGLGSWITGNAPFFDSAGNLVGAVGLDFEASSVLQLRQTILNSILLSFEVAYVVLFGLVVWMAGALTEPIRKLASAAKLVGEGQYEKAGFDHAPAPSRFPDEIDGLRAVFADMAQKVYKREESLKQQVKELKIEIDQVKAKQQIAEIVETEFFENIAAKAKDIRARTPRAGGSPPASG
jgi:hypothetical protein